MAQVTTGGLIDNPPSSTILAPAQWAIAAGTADAITAAYTTPNTSLPDGLLLGFRASAANATVTPTFAPDGLPSHVITKRGGAAIQPGDIPGQYAETLVRYNLANTRWELLNPSVSLLPAAYIATAGGSADALTASYTPSHGSVTPDGTIVAFRASATNATNAPTIVVDGSTANEIIRIPGTAVCQPGDIIATNCYLIQWNAAFGQWALLNPSQPVSAWTTAGGSADALTLTYGSPAFLSGTILLVNGYYDGLEIKFRAASSNATTGPTLNVNGLGAKTIFLSAGSQACLIGCIQAGGEYIVRYNLANSQWVLLNPTYLNQIFFGVLGGTAQAQTIVVPGLSTIADGTQLNVRCTTANTGSGPTLAVNGGSALTIVKRASTALAAGDMAAGAEYILRYNLANTRWVLLNPVVN